MIRHHIVCCIDSQTMLLSYSTRDGRFARSTPAADPIDVLQLFRAEPQFPFADFTAASAFKAASTADFKLSYELSETRLPLM